MLLRFLGMLFCFNFFFESLTSGKGDLVRYMGMLFGLYGFILLMKLISKALRL
jgi:hypothetical protein